MVISDNHYGIIMVSERSNGVTDIKQDASPAMQDEMFEKDDLTYTVEWNEYLLTHEAIFLLSYKNFEPIKIKSAKKIFSKRSIIAN